MYGLFAAVSFLGAFLLFVIQPLFARMMLPQLGGAPAVWNTAMVFYQAALLAGYAYAHWLNARLPGRRQGIVHLVLLLAAAVFLPPVVAADWRPDPAASPILSVLGVMAGGIGLPFLAVAATAPLIQRWFADIGHRHSAEPYQLYAAGNLGSLLALLGYPLLVEPYMAVRDQAMAWAAGFGLLAVLMAVLGLRPRAAAQPDHAELQDGAGWRRRLHWLALAFVPSSLMLGVSTHINLDVAAVPLFWVVPLAIYILSFVLVFARRPWPPLAWMLRAQSLVLPLVAIQLFLPSTSLGLVIGLDLAALFVTAMVCHGQLVALRPAPRHLTGFYLWMALGGVLGGALNGLLAPVLFETLAEYPLMLVAAGLLRPLSGAGSWWRDGLVAGAVVALAWALPDVRPDQAGLADWRVIALIVGGVAVATLAYGQRGRPLAFAACVAALLLMGRGAAVGDQRILLSERTFFGVHRVVADDSGRFTLLMHGNTVHGAAHVDPARRTEPLTYYLAEGPLGQAFDALRRASPKPLRVALVGLGAGSALCYRRPGDDWTIFEIDPAVVTIAGDRRWFSFVSDCAPEVPVALGDARLRLAEAAPGSFDVMIMDAFSSDAVPVHMLTTEAMALYRSRLAPGGVMLFHLSNRYLDLPPLMAGLAADGGFVARAQYFQPQQRAQERDFRTSSVWAAVSPTPDGLAFLGDDPRWICLDARPGLPVWHDDYGSIVEVLKINR